MTILSRIVLRGMVQAVLELRALKIVCLHQIKIAFEYAFIELKNQNTTG